MGAGDGTAQQLTLADALQRCKKFLTESLKALAITHKVLEFIVLDAQPMSVVEVQRFRRLLEYLEPRYSIPSHKYFPRPICSLLLIQQRYRMGIGY